MSNTVLCPVCRGPAVEVTSFGDVEPMYYCTTDNCFRSEFPASEGAQLPEEGPKPVSPREARHSSAKQEWGTPLGILIRAQQFLGGITLDPASSFEHNQRVQAASYYDEQMNGLAQDWVARSVWLNPPYGKARLPKTTTYFFPGGGVTFEADKEYSSQAVWVAKLLNEYLICDFSHALLLVNAETSASWFQPLWAYPICFIRGRIKFIDPDTGQPGGSPTHGSALVYIGEEKSSYAFAHAFSCFGPVAVWLDPAKLPKELD